MRFGNTLRFTPLSGPPSGECMSTGISPTTWMRGVLVDENTAHKSS